MLTGKELRIQVTREQIRRFKLALTSFREDPDPTLHPLLQKARIEASESMIADLEEQIRELEENEG